MSKVKNFPHLSRGLMDYWFKELLSNRYGSFEDSKIRVKQEISMSYLDYMSVMADRRTQLLNAQTSMAVTMARASANVTQLQYATKELDSLINDLAFKNPRSIKELEEIPGLRKWQQSHFGQEILAAQGR